LISLDCIGTSSWGRNGLGCRESKEPVIWGRRTEERVEINHDVRDKFDGACRMVHGLIGVITHDERILRKGFGAIVALFFQAQHTCAKALFVVHDEHIVFLLHQKCWETHAFLAGPRACHRSVQEMAAKIARWLVSLDSPTA